MAENRENFIFISYSHKDSDFVIPVIGELKRCGFNVWYDSGIEAGSEWTEFIAEKIEESAVVLVMFSKNALESHNCRREINFAIEEKKKMLVSYIEDVKLSPGMRMQLNVLHALHFSNFNSKEEFMDSLVDSKILAPCKVFEEKKEPPKAEPVHIENRNEQNMQEDSYDNWQSDCLKSAKSNEVNEEILWTEILAAVKKAEEDRNKARSAVVNAIRRYNKGENKKIVTRYDGIPLVDFAKATEKTAEEFRLNTEDIVGFFDVENSQFIFTDTTLYWRQDNGNETCTFKYSDVSSMRHCEKYTPILLHDGTATALWKNNCFDVDRLVGFVLHEQYRCGIKDEKIKKNAVATAAVKANEQIYKEWYIPGGDSAIFRFSPNISPREKKVFTAAIGDEGFIEGLIAHTYKFSAAVATEKVSAVLKNRKLIKQGKFAEGFWLGKKEMYCIAYGKHYRFKYDNIDWAGTVGEELIIMLRDSKEKVRICCGKEAAAIVYHFLFNLMASK